jgi:phosphatidylglycerophosphate synthase
VNGPETDRPRRPSLQELREVTQPDAVRARVTSEHWVADVYLRRLSPYLTRLLLRTPISANGVTWLMIATGASAGLALLVPGVGGGALALLLGQAQMLWDCCDGEVARWRRTFSPAGTFLDKIGHYTAESLIPLCLGIRADGGLGTVVDHGPRGYAWLGAVLAVLVLLNKALNDMVHVARAVFGLQLQQDVAGAGTPLRTGVAQLRQLARFLPVHRLFHSVEMTIFAAVAAVGGLGATRGLLVALVVAAPVTVAGHVAAILSSAKLRVPAEA